MLELNSVYFSYDKDFTLHDISFRINSGEILGIIGQSGCGKTTLLKLIFGKLDANQGELFWHNEKILGPSYQLIAGKEDFKYVTQDYELMPYTSVLENIIKPLSRQHLEQNISRARELLEVVSLEEFENTKVKNLSGGQQQRVALAKALAKTPQLLLLDEPFSQIDRYFKNKLRRKLVKFLKSEKVTCVIATHDKDDVLPFADNLLVLKQGKTVALDTPLKLYQRTKNPYIAGLFGDFNFFKIKDIWPQSNKEERLVVYPYEIEIKEAKTPEIQVIEQYFSGQFFKSIIQWKSQRVFVQTPKPLTPKKAYKLTFKKEHLQKRYNLNLEKIS
ncbi:MAG: ATP-binding cassette domain-containing protein [Bacteroidetes bacterium]|jgi:ABC-type Fe3+/spermidine/putrescine transport system ATPase subunit|nr:ATP-binding cassette domain-containing protein [Bacteroidota bacterium]